MECHRHDCREEIGDEFVYEQDEYGDTIYWCSDECKEEDEKFNRMLDKRFGGSMYLYRMWETRP